MGNYKVDFIILTRITRHFWDSWQSLLRQDVTLFFKVTDLAVTTRMNISLPYIFTTSLIVFVLQVSNDYVLIMAPMHLSMRRDGISVDNIILLHLRGVSLTNNDGIADSFLLFREAEVCAGVTRGDEIGDIEIGVNPPLNGMNGFVV